MPGLPVPQPDPSPRSRAPPGSPGPHSTALTSRRPTTTGLLSPLPARLRPSWLPPAAIAPFWSSSLLRADQPQSKARHCRQGENNRRQTPPRRPGPARPLEPRPPSAPPRSRPFPGAPRRSRLALGSHFRWRQAAGPLRSLPGAARGCAVRPPSGGPGVPVPRRRSAPAEEVRRPYDPPLG